MYGEARNLKNVLSELFENYRYDRDYEFDKQFRFDNDFIITLLIYYKNKTQFSNKELKLLLIKEKEKKSNSIVNFYIADRYIFNFDYYFVTPLYIACVSNNEEIVKMLFDYGANVNFRNNIGETALLYLCKCNLSLDIIKLLIDKYKAKIYDVDNYGNTLLHKFCKRRSDNDVKLFNFLIEKGLDINKVNNEGNTPLIELCRYTTKYFYIPLLLENGAEINIRNNKGETALLVTCKYGDDRLVKKLVECGADVNIADNDGNTPLLISCRDDSKLSISRLKRYFIENGADINKANKNGRIPFHELCEHGNNCIINYFIDHGADINKMDNDGNTPLSIARKNLSEKASIKSLIIHGAK
ncbi:ankyrin [Piromyces finnis]|uniref:Ankyrin n=1 Tax=Piromyces finnis TaxID=1754191 RepID=A0A1Y1UTP6_9FUNG|nr:ankyrin [Piromyces finnis]|eukprot:ORX41400.1 ankyrin [Piromyces finnis]